MYKRPLYLISTILLGTVLLLWTLHRQVIDPNARPNGFYRKFAGTPLVADQVLQLHEGARKIITVMDNRIFLEGAVPGEIYYTNRSLEQPDTIRIKLSLPPHFTPIFITVMDSLNIYLFGGNARSLLVVNRSTNRVNTFRLPGHFFNGVARVGEERFLLGCVDTMHTEGLFELVSFRNGHCFLEPKPLEKAALVTMAYEGGMQVGDHHEVMVVSYYSNRILVLDSNAHLTRRLTTVDTVRHPMVYFKQFGHTVTHEKPPFLINALTDWDAGRLFVQSRLRADNETRESFVQHEVVDVYNGDEHTYSKSFYIPRSNDERLVDFKVVGNDIYVLYPLRLVKYTFNDKFLLQ